MIHTMMCRIGNKQSYGRTECRRRRHSSKRYEERDVDEKFCFDFYK